MATNSNTSSSKDAKKEVSKKTNSKVQNNSKNNTKNMKKDFFSKNILVACVVLLGVAFIGQSLYVYNLNSSLNALNTALPKNINLANGLSNYNIDDWANRPFDADKWEPFQEVREMQEHMNRMFNDTMSRFQSSKNYNNLFQGAQFNSNLVVKDEGEKFVVTMDVPDMLASSNNNADKTDNIKVNVRGQHLVISGSVDYINNISNEQNKAKQEYSSSFTRSVMLPAKVKKESLKTNFYNGKLVVTIEKDINTNIKQNSSVKPGVKHNLNTNL